jgi:hypothetical protein
MQQLGKMGRVMISKASGRRAAVLIAVTGAITASPSAEAQVFPAAADAETEVTATPKPDSTDIGDLELDWSQLDVTASTLIPNGSSKTRLLRAGNEGEIAWSAKEKASGSAAVSVKQSLSPLWDARIGADMMVTKEPVTASDLLSAKAINGGNEPQSSGTAWAAISAPGVGSIWDKTAIEARVDPAQEQSKLGTSFSKSLLVDQYSLTLQNGYNLIQQGLVPLPGIAAHPARNYETEQSAKLSIGDTGTSLLAGQTLSSNEDKWLRKIGAEQKIFGGITLDASIGETPQGVTNKSVSAAFKRSW